MTDTEPAVIARVTLPTGTGPFDNGGVDVGLERVADHVEHRVRLVGDEHAGFGSDFDGIPTLPDGITGSGSFPAILDALRIRGLSEQSIERIASGNFLRILG